MVIKLPCIHAVHAPMLPMYLLERHSTAMRPCSPCTHLAEQAVQRSFLAQGQVQQRGFIRVLAAAELGTGQLLGLHGRMGRMGVSNVLGFEGCSGIPMAMRAI